jgi:phenylalanyl-tRNA synthetase beta chain
VRDALVRAGLREAVSYSFQSEQELQLFGADPTRVVRVSNPLAADQALLRVSLVPGLVRAVRTNLSRNVRGAALFEVGRTFDLPEPGAAPRETERIGFVVGGEREAAAPGERRTLGFADAKGALEAVMAGLGVRRWELGEPAPLPWHPGRSARIVVEGRPVGVIGELLPRRREDLDLPDGTSLAELDAEPLSRSGAEAFVLRELPRFPPVRRDLAFVVPRDEPAGEVTAVIREAGAPLLDAAVLFDVFEGPPVPEGRRSLAFSLDFRAPDRTLTDEEAEGAVRDIVAALADRFGAELRSG